MRWAVAILAVTLLLAGCGTRPTTHPWSASSPSPRATALTYRSARFHYSFTYDASLYTLRRSTGAPSGPGGDGEQRWIASKTDPKLTPFAVTVLPFTSKDLAVLRTHLRATVIAWSRGMSGARVGTAHPTTLAGLPGQTISYSRDDAMRGVMYVAWKGRLVYMAWLETKPREWTRLSPSLQAIVRSFTVTQ